MQRTPSVTVRRLRGSEAGLFEAHLLRLDDEARRLRFGHPVRDAFLSAYARRRAEAGAVVEGAFVDGELRAVAELRPIGPRSAEAAISVEAPFRRRGIGRRLMERITLRAQNHGIRSVILVCLPENRAMRRLAARLGGRVTFGAADLAYLIPEPAPTVFSLAREAIADGFDGLARARWWDRPAAGRSV